MMNRNMTSLARDRRTARPVFRSFLDGIVLLALTALLLTVQVSPVEDTAAVTAGPDTQPVRASLLPSIVSAAKPVQAEEAAPCDQVSERQVEAEALVILVRRGSGETADIIPMVVRPEV